MDNVNSEYVRYVRNPDAICDVVIPHYGAETKLKKCLMALEPYSDFIAHIVIIDNNKENRGFTKAVNNGIRLTGLTYVLVLNNDCYAHGSPFEPIFRRMELSPNCGIVAPLTVAHDNPDKILHAGGIDPMPGIHRVGSVKLGDCKFPTKVRWVSFPVVLLRRKMIREIGLLDERYFNFCSDADYCYRARSQGWEVWYEPKSVWLHEGGASVKPDMIQGRILFNDRRKFMDRWINGRLYEELNFEVFEEMTGNGKTKIVDTTGDKEARRIKTIAEGEKRQEDTPEGPTQGGEEGRQAWQAGEAGDHLAEVSKT